MSNLIAVAFDSRGTAEEVMGTLGRLQKEHSIELEDAVIVTRDDKGKVKLHQSNKLAAAGAAGGALWGGLIGLIFFVPLFGMAIGAATGAATGALTDVGVDDKFMKDLGTAPQARRRRGDRARPALDAGQGAAGDRALRRRGHPHLARRRGRRAPAPHPRDARRGGRLTRPVGEDVARHVLPAWLTGYRRAWLRPDVVAGLAALIVLGRLPLPATLLVLALAIVQSLDTLGELRDALDPRLTNVHPRAARLLARAGLDHPQGAKPAHPHAAEDRRDGITEAHQGAGRRGK